MRKSAFTLVEIIIVLAITGILAVILSPPVVKAYHKQALYIAARQLEADILEQQQAAISQPDAGNTYQILLDVERDRYILRLGAFTVIKRVTLPPGVDMDEASGFGPNLSQKLLEFNYNGIPRQSGHITLRDRSSNNRYYVIISPVTGRVRTSSTPP